MRKARRQTGDGLQRKKIKGVFEKSVRMEMMLQDNFIENHPYSP